MPSDRNKTSAGNDAGNQLREWDKLNRSIVRCNRCVRLREHCRETAKVKRKSYVDETYWGRPVPNLGSPEVSLLVIGLAPGAHGANRTGRMFTGDRSGDWLYRAMHLAGFATQAESVSRNDSLQMIDAAVTNICLCAPPDNKPLRDETENCRVHLKRTIELSQPVIFLALGGLAWRAVIDCGRDNHWLEQPSPIPKFSHGATLKLLTGTSSPPTTGTSTVGRIQLNRTHSWLVGSYHPSQQNTFTGRLTEKMLDNVFREIKCLISREKTQTQRNSSRTKKPTTRTTNRQPRRKGTRE